MPKRRRRYSRRKGLGGVARNRRWLTVSGTAAITLIGGFVAVVAVQIGPAERSYESSVDETFAASLTPIANESNNTGNELSSMLGGADARLGSPTLVATLDSMVGDADQAVNQFETLTAPRNLTGAAQECLFALQSRAQVLGVFRSSVATLIAGPTTGLRGQSGVGVGTAQAETSIEHLGSNLSVADESWSDCRNTVLDSPGRGQNSVPQSVWVGALPVWQGASVVNFIDSLTQSAPQVSAPPLLIVGVSAQPPAVVTVHGVDQLPMTNSLSLHIVVADRNNLEEAGVVASIVLTPLGATGKPDSVSSKATIGPGHAFSFHPPPLEVTPGASYRIDLTVTGPGQTTPAVRRYLVSVDSAGSGVTS